MNRTTRRAFDQAASALIEGFTRAGPFPDQEATPSLLAEEVQKCFETCQQVDATEDALPPDEIDELGTHALECLSDLGLWAWQLKCDDVRAAIENIALELATWIVAHGGRVTVLEPVVNAITRRANATQDPGTLSSIFGEIQDIIANAGAGSGETGDPAGQQPWLSLHFNNAIIATRTQRPALMNMAYDVLENRLPGHCAAFYAEGLREAAKPAYGEPVREILRERLVKWTPRA